MYGFLMPPFSFGPFSLLLICALSGTDGQMSSSLYGYQSISGVREALLGINAFCDNTCSPLMSQNQLNQCFQNAILQNEVIVQILRVCTVNTRYIIYCTQNALVQLENCALQYSASYLTVASALTKSCFRESLAVGTIDCLRMRFPRLNRLLPLSAPSYGTSAFNTALLGIG